MAAENRLSVSLEESETALLAAADELEAATREATAWLLARPCSDAPLGRHVSGMLNCFAEIALIVQRSITDPLADVEAAMAYVGDLLLVLDSHSQALATWEW